jgi:hypothetical protein
LGTPHRVPFSSPALSCRRNHQYRSIEEKMLKAISFICLDGAYLPPCGGESDFSILALAKC